MLTSTAAIFNVSPRDYDAVLFDMDGVLTKTADVHAAAWKRLFDQFLQERAKRTGEPFAPFDIDSDYREYVDGKPRVDGVASFLKSRGIEVPAGGPDDEAGSQSMHGLGRLKDGYFAELLKERGVEAYEAAVALARELRAHEIKTAVVSASNNCAAVLEAAGISDLFDVRIDGLDVARLGLRGKPAPDAFLKAAERLGVEPLRAVVVEDAISGVEAGCAGGFGAVIGLDHRDQSRALLRAGAHVVVRSLDQVRVAQEDSSTWSVVFDGFDPAHEGTREALCAQGNGYFTTRAASPWSAADDVHYPGTYLAGGYNRLRTDIAGQTVENEDLVNFPNWLPLSFRIGDGEWFDERGVTLLAYRQELDLKSGLLLRTMRFEDRQGRRTALQERRLVSMADMHLSALELSLKPENWSGPVAIRTAIDGRVVNSGLKSLGNLNNKHLVPLKEEEIGPDGIGLEVRLSQSNVHAAQAARTQVFAGGEACGSPRRFLQEPGYAAQELTVEASQDRPLVVEKIATLFTSRDRAISEPGLDARKALARAPRFEEVLEHHALRWKYLWKRFDVNIEPSRPRGLNVLLLLRLNMLHLLQAASFRSIGLDIGVPARGWTGEAYQGHIFWDELFIYPFFNHRAPEITRSLLMYRYRRLDEARAAARAAGYRGAMFPWQSGSNGEEVTRATNLNPRSQRWIPDNSYRQRHIGSAVAYNVWQYFQVTEDHEFLEFYGAEMLLDIARFWSSIATFDEKRGRYEIRGVLGPDEFHDGYPDAPEPGLANNAYTNVMAVWVLRRALDAFGQISEKRREELAAMLDLSEDEFSRWRDISRHMYVPIREDGIISQFEGYDDLREFDWEAYSRRYANIQRLDLILEAEGDTPNRYKLSKQADVLMLFYLFSADELGALFSRLGYSFKPEMVQKNVAYYDVRSSHGSTLSRVVQSLVLAKSDQSRSAEYFVAALHSDISDIQQGTTAEGIHLGAMAGAVDIIQRVVLGIEESAEVLRLNPQLPSGLRRLDMSIRYRGHSLDLRLTQDALTMRGRDRGPAPIRLKIQDQEYEFAGGGSRVFDLRRAHAAAH